MREFLIAITGEWRSYIVGWSILLFFLSSCVYHDIKIKKYLSVTESIGIPLAAFYLLGYIICPYILYSGLFLIRLYMEMFKYFIIIHIIVLFLYFTYSMLFFLSIYKLSFLQRYALYDTKLYLISFPFFIIFVPICSFIVCSILIGEQEYLEIVSLDEILYSKNPSEYIQKIRSLGIIGDIVFSIIFIFPWIIYFYFSSTMKKLWSYIDREFDTFKEGKNILPDGILD